VQLSVGITKIFDTRDIFSYNKYIYIFYKLKKYVHLLYQNVLRTDGIRLLIALDKIFFTKFVRLSQKCDAFFEFSFFARYCNCSVRW